jgi:CRISPR-associated protein Cas5t
MFMKLLRLQIYQPQAHYRLPFTYQRRHTYPIPPYSTVIGFLCNLLGIDGISERSQRLLEKLKAIKISIAGQFESKTTEYLWFRNLSKNSHIKRFGYIQNRSINGQVEHIGGQSPVSIDVLNEMRLVLHFAHQEEEFLREIRNAIRNPIHRLEILHLGRAEDWIVIEELSEIFDLPTDAQRKDGHYRRFFWIPEKMRVATGPEVPSENFQHGDGLLYNLPTFWEVQDFDKTFNRHGFRQFRYIKTKLNDGLLVNQRCIFDEEVKLPIFLAELSL